MHNNRCGMPTRNEIAAFVLLFFTLLLSACSHMSKDGPPNYYVDENAVPNATPKYEQLSKYGNMPHYTVFGRRYYVMRSSKNYEEQGVASWYGSKFHSHSTSSGERYNMLAMTAAHKSLPLPTYVQVTNLSNGRQVIVKVNDRGPFESNRLIDLSYVAAKKLGMLGHGTARVDVKAIDPGEAFSHPDLLAMRHQVTTHTPVLAANEAAIVSTRHPELMAMRPINVQHEVMTNPHDLAPGTPRVNSDLYVQAGAFRNRAYAEKLQRRLTAMIEPPVKINPYNHLYRVQIGPIKDVATENGIHKKLRDMHLTFKKINHGFDIA